LNLLGFESTSRKGPQWYGRCPLPECESERSRSFSVNVALGRYDCHRCRSLGNPLELWAAATKQPFYLGFTSLAYHMDIEWLHDAYRNTRKDGAAGVDGQTA